MIEIKITLNDDGSVTLSGDVTSKVASYGMLEVAREIIAKHHERQAMLVQPATRIPDPPRAQ